MSALGKTEENRVQDKERQLAKQHNKTKLLTQKT